MKLADEINELVSDREFKTARKQFDKWDPKRQAKAIKDAMDDHDLNQNDFDLDGIKLGKDKLSFDMFPSGAADKLADTILG